VLASHFTLDDSMDAFGATVVHHAKPRHAGVRAQAVDLLVDSHERKQVVDPLFHRRRRIIERVTGLLRKRRHKPESEKTEQSDKMLLVMADTASAFSTNAERGISALGALEISKRRKVIICTISR
jgi:hypothetical protein